MTDKHKGIMLLQLI